MTLVVAGSATTTDSKTSGGEKSGDSDDPGPTEPLASAFGTAGVPDAAGDAGSAGLFEDSFLVCEDSFFTFEPLDAMAQPMDRGLRYQCGVAQGGGTTQNTS